jgi:hypothetical protein
VRRLGSAALAAVLALGIAGAGVPLTARPAHADETQVSVDGLRTGWNPNEPKLVASEVAQSDFGQLFDKSLSGQIYGQPLVLGSTLFVTTEKAIAYGLDKETGAQKWSRSFGSPFLSSTIGCGDLTPELGSTSTPVIDPTTKTAYFTTKTAVGSNDATWKLQGVDVDTGADRPGFPVTIAGSPTNDPSNVFSPRSTMQRPGLLLLDGVVYAAFGAHCDFRPYRGYVVGVRVTGTPAISAFWTSSVGNGNDGAGVWQSGGGLVSDGPGRIFLSTGNGFFGGQQSGTPGLLGESVVRLKVNANGSLSTDDWFTPSNAPALDQNDTDLGSGAPTALPDGYGNGRKLLLQEGKDGRLFVLDRDDLGGYKTGAGGGDRIVSVTNNVGDLWGHPAFLGAGPGYAYVVPNSGPLKALEYGVDGNGTPRFTQVGASTGTFPYTSGSPIVTSNGSSTTGALVWVIHSSGSTGTGGSLRAYDAVPNGGVLTLRWQSAIGTVSKFSQPLADGGRVYVGTRDGHVIAFGRPQTAPLATSPVEFGSVPVGSSATKTLTVRATTSLSVTGVTATAPYSVAAPTLPATLNAGDTLDVPTTFAPTAGGDAAAQVTFTTSAGTFTAGVHGLGTHDGLAAMPAALDFGQQPTGLPISQSVLFQNTGTTTSTIQSIAGPAAPFTTSGLPAVGASIAPGASVSVGVTFTPSVVAPASDSLQIVTSTGTVTVPLSGTGINGTKHLDLTPTTLDFGSVPVGTAKTASFTLSNSGNLPLTITKAKAPSGVFSAATPLDEGLVITDNDYTQQVTFTPTSAGRSTATYLISSDDGQGPQLVTLVGVGAAPVATTVPAPKDGGWVYNGSASLTGNDVTLTPAQPTLAGSTIYPRAVTTDGLAVSFTSVISGGTGGEGLALEFLDPAEHDATALGETGAALGFGGLTGSAVTVDTSLSPPTDPSDNFIGLARSQGSFDGHALAYDATFNAPTPLTAGTHRVDVAITGGKITVKLDGATAFSASSAAIPAQALIGFAAATGDQTDVHAVRDVVITPGGAAPAPPPKTITAPTGWHLNGSAAAVGTGFRLTTAAANLRGSAVWPTAVTSTGLTASFTASLSGGGGADGATFSLLDATKASPTSLGAGGAGKGFAGLAGVTVALDTYLNPGDPRKGFIGLGTSGPGLGTTWVATAPTDTLRTGTHDVTVTVTAGRVAVTYDGKKVIDAAVTVPAKVLPAFTAATGGTTQVHAVSNVSITVPGTATTPPPPPPDRVSLPPLTDATWVRNGSASAVTGGVQLTPATANTAGSVIHPTALASNGLSVAFTASITGGTGADGLALALLDAASAKAKSVGASGGGLGWSGLGGVAVTLDSSKNTGDPGADFVGVATGVRAAASQLAYAANTTPGQGLTKGTHAVLVTYDGTSLRVTVDGTLRLTTAVALPPKVLVGFTAGTGGRTDVHTVSNATISAPAG